MGIHGELGWEGRGGGGGRDIQRWYREIMVCAERGACMCEREGEGCVCGGGGSVYVCVYVRERSVCVCVRERERLLCV